MIFNCPHCSSLFPEPCVNGVIFCSNCCRMVESDKRSKFLSAYRLIKKNKYSNYDQLKCHLRLTEDDLSFLLACYENENLSVEEFEKKLA
jgi:hypothetical protein